MDGLTELQVVDGLVEFVDETDGTSVLNRWAPSGRCTSIVRTRSSPGAN